MKNLKSATTVTIPDEFSLVLGGMLYQWFVRLRLLMSPLELLLRRMLVVSLFAWLPLLICSVISGTFIGDKVSVSFLSDIELHIRLLIALPVLLAAELLVHQRLPLIVKQFVERGIISAEMRPKYDEALAKAAKLRDSRKAEVILTLIVYTLGLYLWHEQLSLKSSTWYATTINSIKVLSLAGYWYVFVSIPIFQLLFLRWYFRIFIWTLFLFRVSKLKLKLIPSHPDGAGGLGFLSGSTSAFAPVLFAQGILLSGLVASRILHEGQNLLQFKAEILGVAAVLVAVPFIPLCFFAPKLENLKRQGVREYGALAHRYVTGFDNKWLRGGANSEESILGSADIQSLADLDNSYRIIKNMSLFPFNLKAVVPLVVITLLPVAPHLLTIIPLEDILKRMLQILV